MKPNLDSNEEWEAKVIKIRDRQNGTFEVLHEEVGEAPMTHVRWQRVRSSEDC